jgi:hypothetical protein
MKYLPIYLFLLIAGTGLRAQADLSAHLLRDSWQAYHTNPALPAGGAISVSLPGFYNNLLVTNLTFSDIVTDNNTLDIDNAIAQLGASNILRENLDIETLGLGFRLGPLGLYVSHRLRFNAFFDYPDALPRLIWQGNAQFIGQTIDFAPDVDLLGYHELALGASFDLGDRLTIGARAKWLSGGASIETSRRQLQLTTGADAYDLNVDADFVVNTSGALSYESFSDIGVDFNFGSLSGQSLGAGNSGLAFDLGVALRLDRLTLSASALDLGGAINWDESPTNYSLQGNYAFAGLDVAQQLLDDSVDFVNIADSLEQLYSPTETANAYTTDIGTRYYLSGTYELNEKWSIGALLFGEAYRNRFSPSVAATANWEALPLLRLGALLGWRNERLDNLGLNATLALGPVRLMAATDNIIAAIRPKESHSANFRLGINLAFGLDKNGDN